MENHNVKHMDSVKVIGIDPGTETLGVSIITINPLTFKFENIEGFTITAAKTKHFDKNLAAYQDHRTARITALEHVLNEMFELHQPVVVAVETPFYNFRRPTAFGPLVETLLTIRKCVLNINRLVPLHTVDPPNVKKAIGAKGSADKDAMAIALGKFINEYKFDSIMSTKLEEMDEHMVDAFCVSMHLFKHIGVI